MNQIDILRSHIEIANLHCNRIMISLKHLKPIMPLTLQTLDNLSDESLSNLDMLSTRFSKLHDLIAGKIFPVILLILQENIDGTSALDRLNKLEKLGLLDSTDMWIEMRNIRNSLAHDYPDQAEVRLQKLEELLEQTKILLEYWEFLKGKIAKFTEVKLGN
jgi:hypothetical protein